MIKRILFFGIFIILFYGCSIKDDELRPKIESKRKEKFVFKYEIEQNASIFVKNSNPLLTKKSQELKIKQFFDLYFKVWEKEKPSVVLDKNYWGINFINSRELFNEIKKPLTKSEIDELLMALSLEDFPNLNMNAISLRELDVRVLPTKKPIFLDFSKPGEGFPFDYMQNSQIHPMTPLKVWHLDRSKSWAFIESSFVSGWVDVRDIAFVDEKIIKELKESKYVATIKDKIPVYDKNLNFILFANIGSIFAIDKEKDNFYEIKVAIQTENKNSKLIKAFIPKDSSMAFGQELSETNIATVLNNMLNLNYGWGGLYGNRDCSSMIRDLFVPFGLHLPRNSADQAKAWKFIDLTNLEREEKENLIRKMAKPFITILWKKGHVMLYLGEIDKKFYVAHAFWGIKTKKNGIEDRYIIGKSAITSLDFAKTHPDFDKESGDLLDNLLGFSVLVE